MIIFSNYIPNKQELQCLFETRDYNNRVVRNDIKKKRFLCALR